MSRFHTDPKRLCRIATARICRTAVLTALYVLLTMVSVRAGNLHVTFASLPVVVCALLFGPAEAGTVALLGEFLNQMLSYGFTATTVLWLLPPAVRGLIIGAAAVRALRSGRPLELRPAVFYAVCVCAAAVTTICNTAVIYLDSRIYHYYAFAYVFGDAAVRFVTGMITAAVVATVSMPLVRLLRRQRSAQGSL
jgi:ECF transporter S component (folate family)